MPASGKIVARETMMPLPIAVPRCSWNRSMAARISSRFWVGVCTTAAVAAKDTTPMRTFEGCSATKAFAAACAAEIRLGCTSMARMLPENVHGEDDGLVLRWQRDNGGRPGNRNDHHDERNQKKQRRECDAEISGPCPSPPSPCSSWHT